MSKRYPKCTVYIAVSLDGFIARKNGDLDWLSAFEDPNSDEDYGYGAFIKTVDAIVMGRNTFDKVLTFGVWPYNVDVFVLSHHPLIIEEDFEGKVTRLSGSPEEIISQLSDEGYGHLYIDGGETFRQFLKAGLIQQLVITRMPVLIGNGIPLFEELELEADIKLQHIETHSFDNGIVQSKYKTIVSN